jgi:intracellular septation protein A
MNTLYLIISIFALGAIIGMYLLSMVLQNKMTSKFVAATHGIFVATALILLIYYASQHGPEVTKSIVLFVIAAFGGITLMIFDLTGKSFPKWLAMVHGLIAVTGFILLLIFAFIH